MKRMVKNGDLIDVEPDGTIIAGGKAINGVEANPTGEATETLEKIKIGDVAYNVGGGGSEYTAGSNIQISGSNEIALKSNLAGISSIDLSPSNSCTIKGNAQGSIIIQANSAYYDLPYILLYPYDSVSKRYTRLQFYADNTYYQTINIDGRGAGGSVYSFLTKGSKVPFVPSGDGTYVLKASVSGGNVTYTWELQQ